MFAEREVNTMTTYYRLIFRDGSCGAWSTDYERIVESAKYFNALIEEKIF